VQAFINADPELWQTRLRSVRIDGFSSSIRLENLYWRILEEVAGRDRMTLTQLLSKLHAELLETHGKVENFSSFLRVCCGRYMMLQLAGDISKDAALPIGGLDAERIVAREARRLAPRSPCHRSLDTALRG